MKNSFLLLLKFFLIFIFSINNSYSNDQFNFDVTEIEILDDGNLLKGIKGGRAVTDNGYEIFGDNFLYDKLTNILEISGSVKFINNNDDLIIFADKATYIKNKEIIFTQGNSRAIDNIKTLTAKNFKYDKLKSIIIADEDVEFFDKEKNVRIKSDKITYLKNKEEIFSEGKTFADVENEYKFISDNVYYYKNIQELYSEKKTKIQDKNNNTYELDKFLYKINDKILKGKNVNVVTKIDDNKSDNYFFSEGIFNFNKKSFVSKETKIKVHKDIFDNEEQDPRIYGVSSFGNDKVTVINKGIFTSCKISDDCPPWSLQSEKITHDKINKDMIYKNAILKIYDIPVLYFPKFFHPDPSVDRRTGFLQPQFNNSQTLGSSLYVPYFKTLGNDKDYTFKPTLFDDKYIFQNEFRKENKNSSLITDFSLTKGYKSSVNNKEKNINHIFLKYNQDLILPEYISSDLNLKIERVSNDTYLKVFDSNLVQSPVMPNSKDTLTSELNLDLEHQNYNFTSKFQVFESLGKKHSDRYQYILPSYSFSRNIDIKNIDGLLNFYSSGENNLKDTNNLRTSVVNDFEYSSINYFTQYGLKNNFNLYFKNLNSLGKNDPIYKSSPRVEGMGILELQSSLPLLKQIESKKEILTPKVSFRVNPGNNMKNHNNANRTINTGNVFGINRLGISDSFEAGKSLTLGIDYKIDYTDEINNFDKFLEFKLATVLRDEFETEIPITSTIDKKNSNLFGTINNNLFENLNINYDFSIDNDYKTFESHSINTELSLNNFIFEFDFVEQNNELGSNHVIKNKTSYQLDEKNSFSFATRRNKEINLTEYYDFIYEYKNDCLTAGVKFNKTFYQDNDLKPSENLFFTITLIPLTTFERTIYDQ